MMMIYDDDIFLVLMYLAFEHSCALLDGLFFWETQPQCRGSLPFAQAMENWNPFEASR